MENKEPLFDFLEDVVDQLEVQPTEQARKVHLQAMQDQLQELARQRSTRRLLKGLGGALLLALLLTGLIWLLPSQPGKTTGAVKQSTLHTKPATNPSTVATATNPAIDHPAADPENSSTNPNLQTIPAQPAHKAPNRKPQTANPQNNNPEISQKQVVAKNNIPTSGISGLAVHSAQLIAKGNCILPAPFNPTAHPAIKCSVKDTIISLSKSGGKARNNLSGFSVGVHYTPEFMFNTLDQSKKLVNTGGLEATWYIGPYSIRSGIGISVTSGVTALGYNYNDYLGMTKKLDSVSFSYDAAGRKILPNWFYSDKNVYDTALLSVTNEISKRYTYLQFPLILGYDFHQGEILSFGFRAGPVLQVLIKEEQLNQDPGAGDNQIISINQLTPDRTATHWQALLGFNSSVLLSRRVKLELEPHIKYYFNSVYEKTSTTSKPWSVELRTALIIKF